MQPLVQSKLRQSVTKASWPIFGGRGRPLADMWILQDPARLLAVLKGTLVKDELPAT
jgi:hypothetical protein